MPIGGVIRRRTRELLGLRRVLRNEMMNRSRTMGSVSETVEESETNLGSPGEPVNSFLFLKPAKIKGARLYGTLTRIRFNSRGRVVEVSVSRCVRGRTMSGLVNSPPKCMKCGRNNRLARGMEEGPCSIILFSRVRGTRRSMFGVLLRVLSSNELASSGNHVISFGGAVLVVASGIKTAGVGGGGRRMLKFNAGGSGRRRAGSRCSGVGRDVVKRLGRGFGPRFLGEVSSVVMFRPLRRCRVCRVMGLVAERMVRELGDLGVSLGVDRRTMGLVTRRNVSLRCKTEPLGETVRGRLRSALSRTVLGNSVGGNDDMITRVRSGGVMCGYGILWGWVEEGLLVFCMWKGCVVGGFVSGV